TGFNVHRHKSVAESGVRAKVETGIRGSGPTRPRRKSPYIALSARTCARHVPVRAQLGDLSVVADHEDLDRIHDHRRRWLALWRGEGHVDLEDHGGLVGADDHVA